MRRTTISHFYFSFKRSFHPQSKGDTPQGRTLNPFPSI